MIFVFMIEVFFNVFGFRKILGMGFMENSLMMIKILIFVILMVEIKFKWI